MTFPVRIAWVIVAAAGAVAIGLSWRSYAGARDRAERDMGRTTLLATQVEQLVIARAATERWSGRRRPASGLAARLGETLTACGVPGGAGVLANVSPQPESPLSGAPGAKGLMRQRASLTLAPITLPQLGAFLEAWRTGEPGWTVAGIEVSPEGARDAAPGTDLPLRAVLTLDAVYLDESKGDRK